MTVFILLEGWVGENPIIAGVYKTREAAEEAGRKLEPKPDYIHYTTIAEWLVRD